MAVVGPPPGRRRMSARARAWVMPGMLAVLSGGGLLIALVDDGVWDLAGSLALVVPLLAAWISGRRR